MIGCQKVVRNSSNRNTRVHSRHSSSHTHTVLPRPQVQELPARRLPHAAGAGQPSAAARRRVNGACVLRRGRRSERGGARKQHFLFLVIRTHTTHTTPTHRRSRMRCGVKRKHYFSNGPPPERRKARTCLCQRRLGTSGARPRTPRRARRRPCAPTSRRRPCAPSRR